ncbi:MAG: Uma2 family endonuclease [Cyanobacteria bacterium J06641_5]
MTSQRDATAYAKESRSPCRRADIALVRSKEYLQAHPTPADIFLVVEFSQSSLAKDTEAKRLIYAAAGVEDYWVVNLRDRLVMVYRQPAEGDYQSQVEISTEEIALLAFPDITINVEELLAD